MDYEEEPDWMEEEKEMEVPDEVLEEIEDASSPSRKRKSSSSVASDPKRTKEDEDEDPDADLSQGGHASWVRPPLPPVNPQKDNIAFMLVDGDYYISAPKTIAPPAGSSAPSSSPNDRVPILRLYGVTDEGNSVMAHVHWFMPYFYVPCWNNFTKNDSQLFARSLKSALGSSQVGQRFRGTKEFVLSVEIVSGNSIWGYHKNKTNFMKITLSAPPLISTARRICEKGIFLGPYGQKCFLTYESNIPFVLRFMVNKDIQGGAWLELPASSYKVRPSAQSTSRAQLEVDIHEASIIVHQPEGAWMKTAPLRVLSFDIECAGRKDTFPEAEIDPVIQIANMVEIQGTGQVLCKNVFTLKSCAPIVGAQVLAHKRERNMLLAWKDFFTTVDPDVITGYNIVNFDLPYLLDRARTLGLAKFPYLGRLVHQQTTMKDKTFASKAYGKRVNKEIAIHGRVQFDLLAVLRREYKLRSYTLNAVSAHFLKQQKEDVHHSIITDLQNGNAETRRRLAVYCLKDAWLPLQLLGKLLLLINYIEMARVTGVPISYLLTRGQQIKVVSQLYRKAKQKNLFIPVREKQVSEEKYEGATVIEPKKGFYTQPIATLDFASLYPSIMMAHNLCYTSLISRGQASQLNKDQYVVSPTGAMFVKKSLQPGLLPEILEELLAARKTAKKDMKAAAKGSLLHSVLNGRQLALKISANSVYGFTGAQVGQLPCLEISSSVTAFGRQMIQQTKDAVEKKYTIANGYEHDAEVVYGDTDSVMVKFGCDDVKKSMELGEEAAAFVSDTFPNPIRLEFEKVYFPYLLMNKKRYAGLYWTNHIKHDKMDAKGIETVRRDNCSLVSHMVQESLNLLLINRDTEAAMDYCKRMIADLLCNRLDLSLLVISKALGKSAQSEDYLNKQAHVELAERMRQRDPSSAPKMGDRVPYVIIKASKGAKAYEKAEDPIYVLEHDIPIDTDYYLNKQVKLPLTRIFEPIMGDRVQSLFSGDHTRQIKVSTPSTGGIMRFAVKKRTCLGCKVPLKKDERAVCKHCKANSAALYVKQIDRIRSYEALFSKVWSQCQRCQGSLHQDVLCTSRDCPIFYRRKKVQKDLRDAQKALDRFQF